MPKLTPEQFKQPTMANLHADVVTALNALEDARAAVVAAEIRVQNALERANRLNSLHRWRSDMLQRAMTEAEERHPAAVEADPYHRPRTTELL